MAVAVRKRKPESKGITIAFDVPVLNTFIKYCLCDFVTKSQIQALYKLMKMIDPERYNQDTDIKDRIIITKVLTEALIELNLKDSDLILNYLTIKSGEAAPTLNKINLERNQLSVADANQITKMIDERLHVVYIYEARQPIMDDLLALESLKCVSYYNVISRLRKNLAELLTNIMETSQGSSLLQQFGFSDPNFKDNIDRIVTNAKRPSSILQTGILMLNAALAPGFQSGRFYCFLGCTGKFKSGTLLNIADQIRKFNPQIRAVEDGLRKTILFVTMENSVNETVERMIDMYSDIDDDILDMTSEDIVAILKERGKFIFTDTDGIDIEIRFYGNLEIRVSDLRTIVNDMRENGKECICIILDYIARIESNQANGGDERLRISYSAKNLKSLASDLNIAIITAMQVNREGNAVLDAAMRDNKQDLAQLIGASAVGLSWSLMEECDWVCFVYPERQVSTGKLFLSFKRLKVRGKKSRKRDKSLGNIQVDYFNHPFTNEKEIMLVTDADKLTSSSIISLKTDLVNDDKNAIEEEERFKSRPRLSLMQGGKVDGSDNTIHTTGLNDLTSSGFSPIRLNNVG